MRINRRPRPLPEVAELAARSGELAKDWLLTVLDDAPLESFPSIAGAGLATEGSQICEAVVRALADDDALEAIERGGSAERLIARAGTAAGAREPAAISRAVESLRGVVWRAVRRSLPDAQGDDVALLAERLALVIEVVRAAGLRGADRPWPAVLEDHVARARHGGTAMSLLLVELEDAGRVMAVEQPAEAQAILARVAETARRAVGQGGVVVPQPGGRAWVIAPGAGRSAAEELGSRLGRALDGLDRWRGAPPRTTVGMAVLGEDSTDAAGLIDAAEERRFAAAASGIEISRRSPEPDTPAAS
jgi:hypothetical protein